MNFQNGCVKFEMRVIFYEADVYTQTVVLDTANQYQRY